jgi:S-adenosylmethionine:tRNA ribosyltransferase-isomerase
MITPQTYTLADFDFELPEALIAQYPAPERQQSRLLHVQGKKRTDLHFRRRAEPARTRRYVGL